MSPAAQCFQVPEVCVRPDDTLAPGGLACSMTIGGLDAPIRQVVLLRATPFEGGVDGALIVDLLLLALDAQASDVDAWTVNREAQPRDGGSCVTMRATDRTPDPSPAIGIRLIFGPEAPRSVVNDPRPVIGDILHALSFEGTTYTIT